MSAPPSKHRGREGEEENDDRNNHNHNNHNNHNNNNNNNNNKDEIAPLSDGDDDSNDTDDEAIDETTDLPDDLANIQKSISDERRRQQTGQIHGIQDLLPFPFSPLIRPLTISDLESCIALENAAFANPAHRCTQDKFVYRLTQCPELCMGVFCTVVPSATKAWDIETLRTAHPVETGRDDGAVSVLLAHIVATRSRDEVVTDDAMDYPRDYKVAKNNKSKVGHQDTGRTLCIHSLAVHPKLQGVGLGKLIMKSYMQQAKNSEIADRIALICQEYLVNYYKRFGFFHLGSSIASFSGGGWHDMAFDLGVAVITH